MVYTSKTLIKGKTPIGQNRDGSYIYEDDKKPSPKPAGTTTGIPNVGAPVFTAPTAKPSTPISTPVGPKVTNVDYTTPTKKPVVQDTFKIAEKINDADPRVQELRSHFDYLKKNGKYKLNDKQKAYIDRFKTKNPGYNGVEDTVLYSKIILADPKRMEEYGNIGERTAGDKFRDITMGNIEALGDAFAEGVDAYKNYDKTGDGSKRDRVMGQGAAATAGIGKIVGDTFLNVGANIVNLVTPEERNLAGTTSTSELLGKNTGEAISFTGNVISNSTKKVVDFFKGEGYSEKKIEEIMDTDFVKKSIKNIQENPDVRRDFESALNIANLIPGGIAGKSKSAIQNKIIKDLGEEGIARFTKLLADEAFEAQTKGKIGGHLLEGAVKTGNSWRQGIEDTKAYIDAGQPINPEAAAASPIRKAVAEKIMAKTWKIRPNIRRDIRQKTGQSAEEFALSNNLVGKDVEESLIKTEAFKTRKMNEKADIVSTWGEAPKTPAQSAMATSLKKKLGGTVANEVGADDPELLSLLRGLDEFIANDKTTYQQVDALKSLYDHFNPDDLSWDAQGRLINPAAHQNAAYRRNTVQKMLEEEGAKRGVDIKKINKDIMGSHDLAKGLGYAEERMANNNIISLGDTQIAIMGSLLGGDITGVGILAVKKALGSEGATSFIAKKLYNAADDTLSNLSHSSADRPNTRVGRFTGSDNPSDNLPVPEVAKPIETVRVDPTPAENLIDLVEKGGFDSKGNPIKVSPDKALERFDMLSPDEKEAALAGSPKLRLYVNARSIDQNLGSTSILTKTEQKTVLDNIEKNIDSGEYSMEDLKTMAESNPTAAKVIKGIREKQETGVNPEIKEATSETKKSPKSKSDTYEQTVRETNKNLEDIAIKEFDDASEKSRQAADDFVNKKITAEEYDKAMEDFKTSVDEYVRARKLPTPAKEAPTSTETIEEVVTPVRDTPEVTETPKVEEKFTREQATKYMDDNINRIMKEVKSKKITGEEGKAQMLELQNDMKYLRLGITPEKLKAGKEKLLDGVMEELTQSPKTPQVEGKTAIDEAKKYNSSEKFVIKNKQSDYDNSTFLEPHIGKEIEFTLGNGQRVNGVIYRNTNGDIVGIPNEKFTLRHNGKTIESNFEDFEIPMNSNFKLNGHSVKLKDRGFLSDEISKDIYKQANENKLPKTPQEGKTPTQGLFGGIEGVKPANQAKFNQGDSYEAVRVIMNDKDARIVRYGAIRGRGLRKGFTTADNAEMKGILDELKITREEAINRSDEIKKLAREARSSKEEVILDLTKPKPSLPLSQKSEVKYSTPDTLVQEANKYDYANGFISDYYKKPNILNWGGPEILEGGLPKIKQRGALFLAENSTDGKNYAEGYAKLSSLTGKSKVHQIELDETAKIFDIRNKKDRELLKSKLDEYTYSQLNKRGKAIDWKEIEPIISDIKSLGYDGVVVLERPKGHILDGANGKYKSMSDINSVAIFNPDKIKKAKTNSELLDIYNKANKK